MKLHGVINASPDSLADFSIAETVEFPTVFLAAKAAFNNQGRRLSTTFFKCLQNVQNRVGFANSRFAVALNFAKGVDAKAVFDFIKTTFC